MFGYGKPQSRAAELAADGAVRLGKGLEQLARNLCKEKGLNPEEIISQFKH